MDLIEKINSVDGKWVSVPATDTLIKLAQKMLGLTFPEEYVKFLSYFGAADLKKHELCGLNVGSHANVVDATREVRKYISIFPKNYFVLEKYRNDKFFIVVDEEGKVHKFLDELNYYTSGEYDFIIANSISEYLDIDREKIKEEDFHGYSSV